MATPAPSYEPRRAFAPLTAPPVWRNPILLDGPVIDLDRAEWSRIEPHIAADAMKAGA